MTNFIIHSNAPHVSTGYGVQCALLAERLQADGHNVAISATYGQQGAIGKWKGITMYPMGYTVNSVDTIHHWANLHFKFDPLDGWIIPLVDVWALNSNPYLNDFNIAAWVPVDHFPVPPEVLTFFKKNDAVPVAMSKFGVTQLAEMGLDPVYIPLAVDTKRYKPTKFLDTPHPETGDLVRVNAREWLGIPESAFVVGMVAMNKGWSRDRKGFNEALRAFGAFWRKHNDAVLYLHTHGSPLMDGFDLVDLARHAGVPDHAIVWPDQIAYQLGFSAEQMAATYTAMDVLLAPSHGEGFCVPLIEAQACGVPVIASDFTAQTELVGAGWLVTGQLEWDPTQRSSYLCPFTHDIVDKLEQAYDADLTLLTQPAIDFAAQYDADVVFDTYWRPFLETLQPPPPVTDREPMGDIAVIVPCLRPQNVRRLKDSFAATNDGTATLYVVEEGEPTRTYSENVNLGVKLSHESFLCVVGDDCEFTPGWIAAARAASTSGDVIGTNDSEPGRVRNTAVARGTHADHFLVRRSYIDDQGACLDGPGQLAPEAYRHWYTDREIIGLARARGVYVHAADCRIVHHHPGYDGDEAARHADPVYMKAVGSAEADERTFLDRVPLIEMARIGRGKVR